MGNFIFGEGSPWTYEQLQGKRRVADAFLSRNSRAPQNLGQGLSAIGNALAYRGITNRADEREGELNDQWKEQVAGLGLDPARAAIVAGLPQGQRNSYMLSYLDKKDAQGLAGATAGANVAKETSAKGTIASLLSQGGPVIRPDQFINGNVLSADRGYDAGAPGEQGQGLLPQGEQVAPNPETIDPYQQEFQQLPQSEQLKIQIMLQQNPGMSLRDAMMPEGADNPNGMFDLGQKSFQPGAEVQTADLAGINMETMTGASKTSAQNGAFAYRSLMSGLDEYEKIFAKTGGVVMPGAKKDSLDVARRGLQMQMKELYNLGVLNGPDLMLMDQMLVDPTGIGSNALDFLGISDLEKRIPANIKQVRKMMTDLVEPRLRAIDMSPSDLTVDQLSDEDFLKQLGLE